MKNKKAIVSTSANPFHFGHLDLYKKAKNIFDDVKVVIAQNPEKSRSTDLEFHLNAYNINYEIINDMTIADYCAKHDISYIVRGIRNGVDAEYELKLDFANKEINPNVQTLFIPTIDVYSNISSSTIRELLRYKKYDIVSKYMDEIAMWRFVYGKKYKVYFGKSCVGKSTYLRKIYGDAIVNIDEYFWQISEKIYGKHDINFLKEKSYQIFYGDYASIYTRKNELDHLCTKYLNEEFWQEFFIMLPTTALDWAAFPFYKRFIPMEYYAQMEVIEISAADEDIRQKRIKSKYENTIDPTRMYEMVKTRDEFYNCNKLKILDDAIFI